MKDFRVKRSLIALSVATFVPVLGVSVAFADTNSFASQYQTNASQEASLLQTAENSSVSTPQTESLSSAVQDINTQIATLYSSEQALANDANNLSSVNPSMPMPSFSQIQQQRNEILQQSQQAWKKVNQYFHRNYREYESARYQWSNINQRLQQVDKEYRSAENAYRIANGNDNGSEDGNGSNQSLQNAISNLQNSILNLQQSAIYNTQEWIMLEQQSGNSSVSTLAAPTSLVISNVNSNGWTVSWSAVSGASSYNVYLNGIEEASNVTGTSYTFDNASPGSAYTVTVTAVDSEGNQSAPSPSISVSTPSTSTTTSSTNTNIMDTSADNGSYVTSVSNTPGGLTVTVANGTTASELMSAIQSTDGSTQTYTVEDQNGNTLTGTLVTGDVLVVTSANGTSAADYTIDVAQ